jgi:hypothetical protein
MAIFPQSMHRIERFWGVGKPGKFNDRTSCCSTVSAMRTLTPVCGSASGLSQSAEIIFKK